MSKKKSNLRLRAEGAINALDVVGPRILELEVEKNLLLTALKGLIYRHGDRSDEHGSWGEWDTAIEAVAKIERSNNPYCDCGCAEG